jgi:hypothetical protein
MVLLLSILAKAGFKFKGGVLESRKISTLSQ